MQFTTWLSNYDSPILEILTVYNTIYHFQTNVQSKRMNRTLLAAIQNYITPRSSDWHAFKDAFTKITHGEYR